MSSICTNYANAAGYIGIIERKKPYTGAYFLTVLEPVQSGMVEVVSDRPYTSQKTAMSAMKKYMPDPIKIVFEEDLSDMPRKELQKIYGAEIEWLQDLTEYECKADLVQFDADGAVNTLDMWKKEKIDDIPVRFLIPYGFELLMVLWNEFII